MCTALLPPGDNPIAVNKYIISYHISDLEMVSKIDRNDDVRNEAVLCVS